MKLFWRVLTILGIVLAIGALGLGVWIGPMLYRSFVGMKAYETTPPVLPPNLGTPTILIFSKTNGFRDDAQIQAANHALEAIARRQGWSSLTTENAAVFNPAQLARFKAVVWNSTSGDNLTLQQRADFKTWLEQGGGFVGLCSEVRR